MSTGQVGTSQVETAQVMPGHVVTNQVGADQHWKGQVGTGRSGKVADLLSTLTWDCNDIKMKIYTWNSSVALLSPTCLFIWFLHLLKMGAKQCMLP